VSAWPQLMGTLLRERGRALYGYAYVLTGSPADAEDLVQDAMVKVFSRQRRLESLAAAESYVRQTMRTLLIDDRRHHRHRREVQGVVADQGEASAAARIEASASLHLALLSLPPRERVCVVMRFMDDLTFTDIAAQLDLAEGTVRRYTHDGIRRLGERAAEFGITRDLADQDHSYTVTVYARKEA